MADKTTPTASDPAPESAPEPVAAEAPTAARTPDAPTGRRTVTLPVLPFAIVGAVLVALIFFGGGIAVGVAIGDHHARAGIVQPFNGRTGPFGGLHGFGQKGDRNGGLPGQNLGPNGGQNGRPTPAPTQG